jgi:hypothetical protein
MARLTGVVSRPDGYSVVKEQQKRLSYQSEMGTPNPLKIGFLIHITVFAVEPRL